MKSLESELEGLQQNFKLVSKERDSHAQETTKAQFEASQQKMNFDEILDGLQSKASPPNLLNRQYL